MSVRFFDTTFTLFLAAGFIAAASGDSAASAQAEPPASRSKIPAAPPPTLRSNLDKLPYAEDDPRPILIVAPDETVKPDLDLSSAASVTRISLATLARWTDRKVATAGEMTALVPRTMKEIERSPGKANPYRGLWQGDTIQLLMGTLTSAQWQAICSPGGIGLGDLREDQKPLLDSMLPDRVTSLEYEKAFGSNAVIAKPGSYKDATISDRAHVRLRLNLQAQYSTLGGSNIYGGAGLSSPRPGDLLVHLQKNSGREGTDDRATSAFGVTLLRSVPNRLKPAQIDYSSAKLDARIYLGDFGPKSTLGDLIARVAAATRLDIVPDRRVGTVPVFVRGDSARAGDLLQTIALAVTGTYRKVGSTSTYVLTDDIEGIGTRVTRIQAWAKQADTERQNLVDASAAHAAKLDPLTYLAFAPDDPLALTPAQTQRLVDAYRRGIKQNDLIEKTTDLPPTFRADINRSAEVYQAKHGTSVDTSKVRIDLQVSMTFIIPGFGPVLDQQRAESRMQRLIDHLTGTKPSAPAVLDWKWLAAPSQKRVLLVAPRTTAETSELVAAAGRSGFTDAWIRVDPKTQPTRAGEASTRSLLEAACAAGKRAHVRIGADVRLFQFAGGDSDKELNVYGQTGEEFGAAYVKGQTDLATETKPADAAALASHIQNQFANWRSPDSAALLERVEDIAGTPDLSGLVLQATAPPGFVDTYGENDPILTGGELGFTDARRLAFLHAAGIDAIDVQTTSSSLIGIDFSLPFFPDDGMQSHYSFEGGDIQEVKNPQAPQVVWHAYLEAENKQRMQALFQSVRASNSVLPLWIDDRASDYVDTGSWFGTLDDPKHLPHHTVYTDPGAEHAAARAASKTSLLGARPPADEVLANRGAEFVSRMGARALAEGWNGIVIDLHDRTTGEVLRLLRTMPPRESHVGSGGAASR